MTSSYFGLQNPAIFVRLEVRIFPNWDEQLSGAKFQLAWYPSTIPKLAIQKI
jgi:hypothetical protein